MNLTRIHLSRFSKVVANKQDVLEAGTSLDQCRQLWVAGRQAEPGSWVLRKSWKKRKAAAQKEEGTALLMLGDAEHWVCSLRIRV